ncbi:centrosomal protein of 83 kDa-like isoform X2 [Amblyomma americanum]
MTLKPSLDEFDKALDKDRDSEQKCRSRDVQTYSFEKLKAANVSLQEDYVRLQKDLKDALQALHDVRSNHASILQKADKIISEKDSTIKELRTKLSALSEDDLRREIEAELRNNFESYTRQLQINYDKCRASLHEANVQITTLKAQLESRERSHQRALQELDLKHKAEANRLQVEIQRLKSQQSPSEAADILTKLLNAQKENSDLQNKLKGISLQVKELRSEKDSVVLEHQAALHKHAEELALAEDANKVTETKLKSAQSQREALEEALGRYRQEVNRLSQELVSLEEEKLSLKNKLSLAEQRHKAEVAQLKMESVHQKAELETKYEKALLELASAKADAELAMKGSTNQKQLLAEKEKELEKKFHALRAKDWDRARRLESEKLLMEAKLQELETSKEAALERLAESEKHVKRLKQSQDSQKQELEEEVHTLKAKLKALLVARDDTNKVAAENHVLHQRLKLAEEELNKGHATIKNSQEQRETLSGKIEGLQLELQRNKEYRKTVSMCDSKIKGLKSANHEMQAEAVHLKKNVPFDIHKELQDELKKLRRKQREFRSLLEFPAVPEGNAGPSHSNNSLWNFAEVKEKLDRLDQQQRIQMDQMVTLVKKLCVSTHQSLPSSVDISLLSRQSGSSESSSVSKK